MEQVKPKSPQRQLKLTRRVQEDSQQAIELLLKETIKDLKQLTAAARSFILACDNQCRYGRASWSARQKMAKLVGLTDTDDTN